jgi:hypothetical protein
MKESKVLYYETKQKQRALHEIVTGLKDKNGPAHALLEYVFASPLCSAQATRILLAAILVLVANDAAIIQNLWQEAFSADQSP